ncbi:3-oxoacyl-[acyl-carrier protein] reductase [Pseudochelatococcus lubricantis]|uniref:3-oxoacyl-[acyl-carrier protein] reductase n=1 Tax=Pseudochelatococcus lubricantis TaxID=1538102 RepID=A0ABX0UXJ6_9HYPH|nr:glucose 1-dehydrogenase [Pseudochelatococcus lubricantis]NIJ56615.1 3-oxoacyl-[acyl-carrier protein] reductase [Pseudochelatococcus lubricantis]
MKELDLEGRVVLVTGAAQGIGRTLSAAFTDAGAAVAVADINLEKAQKAAEELVSAGGRAHAIKVDVGDASSVDAMVAEIEHVLGHVDILINNAAIFSTLKMQPFEDIPLDVWERVQRVNVTGPFLCARAVMPAMRRRGFGRIVNISSGAVTLGRPNYLHYTTSKAALIGMTRSMAREVGAHGITVNAVLPGSVETEIDRETVTSASGQRIVEMQCIPRRQVPDDLVGVMLFLASRRSDFITGQSITVDGGATHP